jgi:hypothetical protein
VEDSGVEGLVAGPVEVCLSHFVTHWVPM